MSIFSKYQWHYGKERTPVTNNKPLFDDEPIEESRYGPVVWSVYHTYKRYGISRIHKPDVRTSINLQTWKPTIEHFDESSLTNQEKNQIETLVLYHLDK